MPASDPDAKDPATPGERTTAGGESRRLAAPPSDRYRPARGTEPPSGEPGSALKGPLLRAAIVAVVGGLVLTAVGTIVASTAGLLFVAGVTGAIVGLVLARAAVPGGDVPPVGRRQVAWLAIGLSVGAVGAAAVATWAYARSEGGTLGLIDYLLATFGPFVPAEALVAAVTAWWGASTGPVQS